MKEKTIVNKALKYLNALDRSVFFKIHGNRYQHRGLPDLVGCYRGRFVGLEFKQEGKKPTPIQVVVLRNLADAGAIAGVCYSLEDVKEKLDGI